MEKLQASIKLNGNIKMSTRTLLFLLLLLHAQLYQLVRGILHHQTQLLQYLLPNY